MSGEALDRVGKNTVADFYVASNGNDQQPGTREKPFQSLFRARDAVLELKSKSRPEQPIVVMLRGGAYSFTGPVVFSGRDSGTEKSPIIYTAYPGETPILSGGQRLTGWKIYKGQIMSTVLPKDEDHYYFPFRQLFFNGKRQIRARYPNFDPQNPLYSGWAFIDSTVPADSTQPVSFRWEPGVFTRRWAKPEQGEVFIIPGLAWYSDLLSIRAVDFDQRTISVTRRLSLRWNRLTKGNRFYVENLLKNSISRGSGVLIQIQTRFTSGRLRGRWRTQKLRYQSPTALSNYGRPPASLSAICTSPASASLKLWKYFPLPFLNSPIT